MNTSEAAELINGIAKSIRGNPGQFQIQVSVTGQSIVSRGGTGLQVIARGGGPGSVTIGNQATLNSAGIEVAIGQGRRAMDEQISALVSTLESLAEQLNSTQPDKTIVHRLYERLKNTWVPGVITSVVGTAIAKSIGV